MQNTQESWESRATEHMREQMGGKGHLGPPFALGHL